MQIFLYSALAMVAFAANSVLCRMALAQLDSAGQAAIDPAAFTIIRVISAAITLVFLGVILPQIKTRLQAGSEDGAARTSDSIAFKTPPHWPSVASLCIYMIFFSFAYIELSAGTGALILFGAVQLTMFAVSLSRGEYFSFLSWVGLIIAIGGLVYLVAPGVRAPDPFAAVMMAIAGIGWGAYSILGKSQKNNSSTPMISTMENFIYSIPLMILLGVYFIGELYVTTYGIFYAILSGAIASGVGYSIWYAILPHLQVNFAAILQLSVPAIAAVGGIIFLDEAMTFRLAMASAVTLGGVALVLLQRRAH